MEKYDVSVLVLTYNPRLEALKLTLNSAIKQEDVNVQIVISDDGSKEFHIEEIERYFNVNDFVDYKVVRNEVNEGTVRNFYSGLLECDGKYVKAISPGDMLVMNNSLINWLEYIQQHGAIWSFCDTIFYTNDKNKYKAIKAPANPNNKRTYINGTEKQKRWQYVVLNDLCIGASMLFLKKPILSYAEEMLDNVKYAEDNIWRLAMFDGVPFCYYDNYCVLYEYGTGISTTRSDIWGKRLKDDWDATDKIIFDRQGCDAFQDLMKKKMKIISRKDYLRCFFIKGYLRSKISFKLFRRKTEIIEGALDENTICDI